MQPVRGSHRSPEGVHPDYPAADGDLELGAGGVEGGGLYWELDDYHITPIALATPAPTVGNGTNGTFWARG